MSIEFKLPDLGEGVEEGQVASIVVSVGDTIAAGDVILELETGKSAVDVESENGGKILEIKVSEGDTIKPGDVLIVLDGEATASAPVEAAPAPAVESAPVVEEPVPAPVEAAPAASTEPTILDFALPNLGEGVEEAQVAEIVVAVGETVSEGDTLLELETGKSAVPLEADFNGIIKVIKVAVGDTIKEGDIVIVAEGLKSGAAPAPVKAPAKADPTPASKPTPAPIAPAAAPAPIKRQKGVNVPAAPSTRRFAREIGISIADVAGSGPAGRISIEDVKAFSKKLNEGRASAGAVGGGIPQRVLPDFSKFGEIDVQKMSKIREITAEGMAYSWATVPHVTQFDKADITDLEVLRKTLQKRVERQGGGKLTATAVLIKIVAQALKKFPQFNASIDMANKSVIYKKYVNIGIAVDTPKGLLVPVLKAVDQKNIIEISAELAEIAGKARAGKIMPADMQGGTFTISNVGAIGGTAFTPIVNTPEVAILGIARGSKEPLWDGEKFIPRDTMPLSLSYDHRIIDGADGARFLRWICEAMETPLILHLEG